MSRSNNGAVLWTAIALALSLLAAGCGRKGGLDAPPSASAAPAPSEGASSSLGNTSPGALVPGLGEEQPAARPPSEPRRKRIPLDPLID